MLLTTLVISVFGFVSFASAQFSETGKNNVVVYWGQGPAQQDLIHYCQQGSIDVIVLSFVHLFPAQADGYPGTNFGNQCSGAAYSGPGYNGVVDHSKDALQSSCPNLVAQIPICQKTYGKKILLGLGGGTDGYQLTGATDGTIFANMLWGMFGPRSKAWVAKGLPRPFDVNGVATEVDGFTLDIEHAPTDNSQGYKALANRLRGLYNTATKRYYLTAAPQCVVPDASLSATIRSVKFDALYIQFYNTPSCSAANWVAGNPSYTTGSRANTAGFTYDAWSASLKGTPSAGAKLYLGLAGGPSAASSGQYINQTSSQKLAQAYYCKSDFGGVAIWEATYADANLYYGQQYYMWMKRVLLGASVIPSLQTCPV